MKKETKKAQESTQTFYEILHVAQTATADEIKAAYYELAKIYHPDVNSDEGAAEQFSQIEQAYSVLVDEAKRAEYDQSLPQTSTSLVEYDAATTALSTEVTTGVKPKNKYFNALRIAYIAMFTALSFALRMLEFSILPAVPYLQMDFSDVFILICAYALGPVSGIIAGVAKEVIYGIFFTHTFFVGELANIVILVPFILLPSLMYKKHKGIKSVIFWMIISCLMRTAWSFPVNLLLNFPVFVGFNWQVGMPMFLNVWYWVMLFNLIKSAMLAVVILLLYKSVSRLLQLINSKFANKMAKSK